MIISRSKDSSIITIPELVELERLSNKYALLKHALGHPFTGVSSAEIADMHDVLNIMCGPGPWALDVAQNFRHIRVTGIDGRLSMLAHANRQIRKRQLDNASFLHVPDFAQQLPFAENSFDFISAQFLSKSLLKTSWIHLIQECLRVLRPGGQLSLTEFEVGLSNAPAHAQFWDLFVEAMHRSGRSFSSSGHHLGILCAMESLFLEAGFRETQNVGHMINYSHGMPLHQECIHDFLVFAQGVQPLLVETGVCTQQQCEHLYQQQQHEMQLHSFHAVIPMMTLRGKK